MPGPGERIPREVLLHEVARALRATMPDRAEELLRELEKRLLREPPSTPRSLASSGTVDLSSLPATALAELTASLVENIEERMPNGARVKWSVEISREPGADAVRVEVRATPRGS